MSGQDHRVTERALRRLARRSLASERHLLEVLSAPVAMLTPAPDGTATEALTSVVERAAEHLPGHVTTGPVEVGTSGLVSARVLCDGEPDGLLVAVALKDEQGGVWVSAGGVLVPGIGDDGTVPVEDLELMANRLNDICPVGCWGVTPDGLILSGGVVAPLQKTTDEHWLRQVASAAVDVVAYSDTALRTLFETAEPGPHPLTTFRQEEEAFLRSAGETFAIDDLDEAVEHLLSTLPPLLSAGIEVERNVDGLLLKVPAATPGKDPAVSLLLSLSEQPEWSSIPSGVHLSGEIPVSVDDEDAAEWAARLNGYDAPEGAASPLVSLWQAGNWYHAAAPQGLRRLMFYAVVPNRLRGVVDLGETLAGLVREVCHSSERVMFTRRFSSMLSGQEGPA